ncbi:hypothetical protein BOTCAL_0379g00120 [Botryotinia calthae]|uniref:Uncharacterized protein n=1 Tax=Botryotinia calthae TaxID=38488 RepID=A0A4Y8CS94_9HELO|nr:hypothetical protein BOTCAL_0379g00120 [Botryotinia calthae]
MDTISTPPSILPHSPQSPHSPGSLVDYAPHLEEIQYVDIKLRQHQQHLPSPNLTSPSNSATPQPSHFEEIPTPTITSAKIDNNDDNFNNHESSLKVLSDWGLTFEEIDIARHWGQNPDESFREKVHMQLLAECATSITNPWSLGDVEELYREYDTRMVQWNSTIKMSNQSLEKRQAEKALSELVTKMELAGYKNEEMRWVSVVLSCSEQTFWAMKEWCDARLERVMSEIEINQQRRVPEMKIERRGSPEASENTPRAGKGREMEVIGVETEMKRQRCISETRIKICGKVSAEYELAKIYKGGGNEEGDEGDKDKRVLQNFTSGNHKLSHDTQERTSQINSIPQPMQAIGTPETSKAKKTAELMQATNTQTYTQIPKSPNPTQIINIPNYTQDTMCPESMPESGTLRKSANMTNTRKRAYTDSNNLDGDPSHTKRLHQPS